MAGAPRPIVWVRVKKLLNCRKAITLILETHTFPPSLPLLPPTLPPPVRFGLCVLCFSFRSLLFMFFLALS